MPADDRVALFPQTAGEPLLGDDRLVVAQRIQFRVQFGHQPDAVFPDIPARLVTPLVVLETLGRVDAGHAHVEARFFKVAPGIEVLDAVRSIPFSSREETVYFRPMVRMICIAGWILNDSISDKKNRLRL